MPELNLIHRLYKWASRQSENFHTEAFAFVIEHLCLHEPVVARDFWHWFAGGRLNLEANDLKSLAIRTQLTGDDGRPDLDVRTLDHHLLVEIKVEASLQHDQLARYRQLLGSSGLPRQTLILLSRYPVAFSEAEAKPDLAWRWHHVAEWFEKQAPLAGYNSKVSEYLVGQFVGFLSVRNMTMSAVTWELATGVRALKSLLEMVSEAIASFGYDARQDVKWGWSGYIFAKQRYWIGVSFDEPQFLWFGTYKININREAAAEQGLELEEGDSDYYPAGCFYQAKVDLEAEQVHFFARSRASQLLWLEGWIRENVHIADKLELAPPN